MLAKVKQPGLIINESCYLISNTYDGVGEIITEITTWKQQENDDASLFLISTLSMKS